ncbi:MAG: alkaline phosphatase family protein [Nocardioidaceae bacterium]
MKRRTSLGLGALASAVALIGLAVAPTASAAPGAGGPAKDKGPLGNFKHLVVIYEENHSFDNLYGGWGPVDGQHVVGRADADAAHTTQVAQGGRPYTCLKQLDVNLNTDFAGDANFGPNTLSKQPACNPETVTFPDGSITSYTSHFLNAPFNIDQYIPADATTCPRPNQEFTFGNGIMNGATNPDGSTVGLPGGCTRDLVHKFYQEQYQLDGGKQDRYVTGSDSVGMTMGYYDTTRLPIYKYLHGNGAPNYVIADHFFQAAFGGSYLNHQYLVGAQPLLWPGAPAGQRAVLDSHGIAHAYPLLKPDRTPIDGAVTQACGTATTVAGLACGDFAVNTLQPSWEPQGTFGLPEPAADDTTKDLNIGDRMSDAGVSWAWYAGGWDNAAGNIGGPGWTNGTGPSCSDPHVSAADGKTFPYCPDSSFQFHHQPFNYFTRYAPGKPDRTAHLKDEVEFIQAAKSGNLPQVSFVKPLGNENEHPGYASEPNGSDHLVDLIKAIQSGPQAGNTLIVVTYDEFGGQWDHVPPPGLGTTGPSDQFGPGTRIPALLIGRSMTRSGVDHSVYDTTSIMATIEHQFGLAPVDQAGGVVPRDGRVADLGQAVKKGRSGKD